jgi:hypothetical protein
MNQRVVMAGHRRSKNGVASLAYDPAIHRPRSGQSPRAFLEDDGLPGQARQ